MKRGRGDSNPQQAFTAYSGLANQIFVTRSFSPKRLRPLWPAFLATVRGILWYSCGTSWTISITKLRTAIRELKDASEFVLIDTPPNLGLLLAADLIAATRVLISVQVAPLT